MAEFTNDSIVAMQFDSEGQRTNAVGISADRINCVAYVRQTGKYYTLVDNSPTKWQALDRALVRNEVGWLPILPTAHTTSGTRTSHLLTSAPSEFCAVQVIFPNPDASVTVTRCAIAVTESKANPIVPRIGGVDYNEVAASNTQLGWIPVTFAGGSASGVLPAGTSLNPSYLISDKIPLSAIPRTDGGKFSLIMCRAYWSATTHPMQAVADIPTSDALDVALAPYTYLNFLQSTVDGVTTPSSFTNNTTNNNIAGIGFIFHTTSGGNTVVMAGDSIMAQIQETATALQRAKKVCAGWAQSAVAKIADETSTFIGQANLARGGSRAVEYSTRFKTLAAAEFPITLGIYSPWTPNVGALPYTSRIIINEWHQYAAEIATLAKTSQFNVLFTTPTPYEFGADSIREAARARVNNSMFGSIDFNPLLYNAAGPGDNKWKPEYRYDAAHPNELGVGAMRDFAVPIIRSELTLN